MENVTHSLRREPKMFGIGATVVGPGAVSTPFGRKHRATMDHLTNTPWADLLEQFLSSMVRSGESGLAVEEIAKIVETALTAPSPTARHPPVPNKWTNYYLLKALPKRRVERIFISRLKLDEPAG